MKDRNERGFTLIELVIAMTILTIVMALSAKTFRTLVHGSAAQKASTETELGKIVGLELIRLDLEM